jgi:hypothetical protein
MVLYSTVVVQFSTLCMVGTLQYITVSILLQYSYPFTYTLMYSYSYVYMWLLFARLTQSTNERERTHEKRCTARTASANNYSAIDPQDSTGQDSTTGGVRILEVLYSTVQYVKTGTELSDDPGDSSGVLTHF